MTCPPIDRFAGVGITVHDPSLSLQCLFVWMDFADGDAPELAYVGRAPFDSSGFLGRYSSRSTIAKVGTDYNLIVFRMGGYPRDVNVHTKVLSNSGGYVEIVCDQPIVTETMLISNGAGIALGAEDTGEPYPLVCITDHVADGVSLLLPEFDESVRLIDMLKIGLRQVQMLEDELCAFRDQRDIDQAGNAFLDEIGALVLDVRGGRVDSAYRDSIKSQARVIRSRGTLPDLIAIVNPLVGALFPRIITAPGRKHLFIEFTDPTTQTLMLFVNGRLQKARMAAENVQVIYTLTAHAAVFTAAPADVSVTDAALGFADDGATSGGRYVDVLGYGD